MLAFAATSWVALSMWLLGGRALHQRRYKGFRRSPRPGREGGSDFPGPERSLELRTLLAGLPRRSIEHLAADSDTPSWLAEELAVQAIRRRGAARLIEEASEHRGERGRRRRIVALRILRISNQPEALNLLRRALLSGDRDVAGAAVSLLGVMPDVFAAELLVRALRGHLYQQSRVAARLDLFPIDIPDIILPLVHDSDPIVRYWGATLLARYGGSPEVASALAGLERDNDAAVRKATVESLGVLGGPAAVATALRLLDDPEWLVRAQAARALGDLQRVDLASRVLPLLADGQWWVRAAAMEALQAMGPAVVPTVAFSLDHPDRFARNGAAEVLQNLGFLEEGAVRALQMDTQDSRAA